MKEKTTKAKEKAMEYMNRFEIGDIRKIQVENLVSDCLDIALKEQVKEILSKKICGFCNNNPCDKDCKEEDWIIQLCDIEHIIK